MDAKTAKTSTRVARTATQADALPTQGMVLIGIFGSESAPEALLRFPSGRLRRVKPGSRLSAGVIEAIDSSSLILSKNGQNKRLKIPGS
ncbi:hypothetical protein GG681_00645 [Epibacterium sp. SM1969]|uniref:Type IV pilus biogenesis n=1 Tax=Tritonibacter aquimaris TaxID=2663379 RepID=A0A844AJV6_9RHOB|nr:hypothetical protein [Tritonibacter aquimaris]MQY41139.1 hypothetical protein [Tritonibacter aquimaris]